MHFRTVDIFTEGRRIFDAHTVSMLFDPTRSLSKLSKEIFGKSFEEFGGGTGPMKTKDDASGALAAMDTNDIGAVDTVESVEAQAAQRRLARLSKYFTSPTGVLETPTGQAGLF